MNPGRTRPVSPDRSYKRLVADGCVLIQLLLVGLLTGIGLKPADSSAQRFLYVPSTYCRTLQLEDVDCARTEALPEATGWIIRNQQFESATNFVSQNNPNYCLTLEVSLPAGTRIDFNWGINTSDVNLNRLQFYINNNLQMTIPDGSGTYSDFTPVQQYADYPDEVPITSLRWCHYRTQQASVARLGRLNFVLPDEISPPSDLPALDSYCRALNLYGEGTQCNLIASVDTVFNGHPWRGSSFEVVPNTGPHIGPNSVALRAAENLPNGSESCFRFIFNSVLQRNSQVIFYGQVYSEADSDFLKFYAGENELYSLSGFHSNFQRIQRILLDPAEHLTWCYEKDERLTASQDTARVDVLSIEAPATAAITPANYGSFCRAWLNNRSCDGGAVAYTTDYPWTSVNDQAGGRSSVATITPNLPNNSQSCLSLRVSQLPLWSRITLTWRALTHSSDFLGFYIDGRLLGQISNTDNSYRNASFVVDQSENISNTDRVLSWCYVTDEANTPANDFIGLDNVSIFSQQTLQTGINATEYCNQLDGARCSLYAGMLFTGPNSAPWSLSAAAPAEGRPIQSIRSAAVLDHQRSCFVIPGLNLPVDTVVEFQWAVSSEANSDFLRFRATDGVSETAAAQASISGLSGTATNRFEQVQFRVIDPAQARRLSWCFERDDAEGSGANAGWLAQLRFHYPDDLPVVIDDLSGICQALGLNTGECGLVRQARRNARQNPWAVRTVNRESVLEAPNEGRHVEDEPIYRQSCLALDVDLPAQTRIRFQWRLTESREINTQGSTDPTNQNDQFRFFINGDSAAVIGLSNHFLVHQQTVQQQTSELRWCHQINSNFDAYHKGDAHFYDLSFELPVDNIANLPAVCAALDIGATDCPQIIIAATHTVNLPWAISSTEVIVGNNALRLDASNLRGFSESCYTLTTRIPLLEEQSLSFFRRLNGSSSDSLRFLVNGTERNILNGNGRDSLWRVVSISGPLNITALEWCYLNPAAQQGEYAAIDALTIGPALTIAARPDGQRQQQPGLGLYRFEVNVNVQQNSMRTIAESEVEPILLSHSDSIEVSAPTVTAWRAVSPLYELDFTIQFDPDHLLRTGTTSGQADSSFNISILGFPATQAGGYQLQVANSELLQDLLCQVLEVGSSDCSAIVANAVVNSQDFPWVITEAGDMQALSGRSLSSYPQPLPAGSNDSISSLAIDVNLPAGTGVQFHRQIDADCCERLSFSINDIQREALSGTVAESYQQTRLYAQSPVPLTSLSWQFLSSAAPPAEVSNRAWIDRLSFIPPVTTVARLCAVLDLDDGDCELINAVDTPDTHWVEILSADADSSLRPHPGASRNNSSCLVLDVDLAAGTRIDFELAYNLPSAGDGLKLYAGSNLLLSASGARTTHTQQRLVGSAVNTLRWCLEKGDTAAVAAEFVDLNQMSITTGSETQQLSDRQSLCRALDLNSTVCALVTSFTHSPASLLWSTSDGVTPQRGSEVLELPATTLPGETSCVNLSLSGLQAGLAVQFSWRLDAAATHALSFSVNGNRLHSLQGTGADSNWSEVLQPAATAQTVIESLQWCYAVGSDGTTAGRAWIDNLQFGFPENNLAATIPTRLDGTVNRYRFVITATAAPEDGDLPELLEFELEPQAVGISSISYIVTTQSSSITGLFRRAFEVTAEIELNAFVESGILLLSQTNPLLTGNPQFEVVFDDLAEISLVTFCQALALSEQDCNLLTAVSSTADYPWQIIDAEPGANGHQLRSGGSDDVSVNSCLQLELALAARSRIDFLWALDAGSGDRFQFLADDQLIAEITAQQDAPTEQWQQRLNTTETTSLSWCYVSASGGSTRGMLRHLNFQPPEQAALIVSKDALCEALDFSSQCEQISSFIQQHSDSTTLRLSWAITDAQSVAGNSSLRSPLSVAANGESCLKLAVDLPAAALVSFSWQVDSDPADFLRFNVGDTVISSISGNLEDNRWRATRYRLASAATEISWCFDDTTAADSGPGIGWVDQLRINSSSLCDALHLSSENCALITAFSNTDENPWEVIDTPSAGVGVQGNGRSCFGFELSLPVGSRIDFQWGLEAGSGEQLEFFVNDYRVAATRALTTAPVEEQQQRLSRIAINSLSWCYSAGDGLGTRTRISQISFVEPPEAALLSDRESLCAALDISALCDTIDSFTQQHSDGTTAHLSWAVDTDPSAIGRTHLRSPLTVPAGGESCLALAVTLPAATRIRFRWQVDSADTDFLRFKINDTVIASISGRTDNSWNEVSHTLAAADRTISWCFDDTAAERAGRSSGWVDQLRIEVPNILDISILEISSPESLPLEGLGLYRFSVSAGFAEDAVLSSLNLELSGHDNISTSTITISSEILSLRKVFTLTARLQALQTSGSLTVALVSTRMQLADSENIRRTVSLDALSIEENICAPLDLRAEACRLISGFSSTDGYPWRLTSATFQVGSSLLQSAIGPPIGTGSCLELELNYPAAAAFYYDFIWTTDSAIGDVLTFNLDNRQQGRTSGRLVSAPPKRRLSSSSTDGSDGPHRLSWCYFNISTEIAGTDRGWLDHLNFSLNPADQLFAQDYFSALDLSAADRRVFGEPTFPRSNSAPQVLSWIESTEQSLTTDTSSLQTPYTVPEQTEACFQLPAQLPPMSRISFFWRVDSHVDDYLRFRIDGATVQSISGLLEQNPWAEVNYTVNRQTSHIAWCFSDTSVQSAGRSVGWIDRLQISAPQFAIISISTPTLGSYLGEYRFTTIAGDPDGELTAPRAVSVFVERTGATGASASAAVVDMVLRQVQTERLHRLDTAATITVRLTGPPAYFKELSGEALSRTLRLAPLPIATICEVLDMSDDDCTRISSVNQHTRLHQNSNTAPWRITVAPYRDSERVLSSYDDFAQTSAASSCFSLNASLPAGSRIDFTWAVDSATANGFAFAVNGRDLTTVSGRFTAAPQERQQRIIEEAVRSLRWCFDNDLDSAAGSNVGWIDLLSFHLPEDAPLLADKEALCSALDMNSEDCARISGFSQQHSAAGSEGLSWAVTAEDSFSGDTSLRSPLTVPELGQSCLVLTIGDLPVGQRILFDWQTDSASADFLRFRADNTVIESLSGELENREWTSYSYVITGSISEIAWCFDDTAAESAGQSLGWIDQLRFRGETAQIAILGATAPVPTHPLLGEYRFTVTVGDFNEIESFPEQLELTVTTTANISSFESTEAADGINRIFTFNILLQEVATPGELTLAIGSIAAGQLKSDQTTLTVLIDTSISGILCSPLNMEAEDCELITGISSIGAPWELTTASFQVGNNLYASASALPDNGESCLILTVNLPAASRIDFTWAVDSHGGDQLRFAINGDATTTAIDGLLATAPHERQQRISPVAITALNWCYRKNATAQAGADRGWLDSLAFFVAEEAPLLPDKEALCVALDLSTDDCAIIDSFTQMHSENAANPSLSWAVTSAQSVAGGSSLRSPLTVPETGESCLSLSTQLPSQSRIRFRWQVDSAAADFLRFSIDDTVISSISGGLADNPWREIDHLQAAASQSISWCFDDTAAESAGISAGWIDRLQLLPLPPQYGILSASPPAPQTLGLHLLNVTVRDFRRSARPAAELAIGFDNLNNVEVSLALDTTGMQQKVFTVSTRLLDLSLAGSFSIFLHGVGNENLSAEQSSISITVAAATETLCEALDISTEDCARISALSTTLELPWQPASNTFQNGNSLLASTPEVPDDGESCLRLELSLPATSRIDFSWAVDSAPGDQLQFAINGETITAIDGRLSTAPHERQQRLSAVIVEELSWCYRKNNAGMAGADRGWLDSLAFFVNEQAPLLPDRDGLCMALDLSSDDCALIGSFSQTHSPNSSASLSWALTEAQSFNGGSSLRSPLTVPETGESCLVLSTALPSHTRIRFHWQVDSAAADFLRFRVGDTVIASISGSLADNPWREINHLQATAFDSISWCFDDTAAASAGISAGWIDQLQLIPLPQFAITRVTAATALPTIGLGYYRFEVVAEDSNNGFNVMAALARLRLDITGQSNIVSSIITSATTEENSKRFTVTLQLQDIDTASELTIALNHSDTSLLAVGGNSQQSLLTAPTAADILCPALDLDDEDCALISGFATTSEYPWRVTTTTFQVGENLLTSARAVPADGASCLTLTLNLEAGSRIDFNWSVHSLSGDSLQFSINNLPSTIGIEGTLPVHRQQRFSNVAISNLSWCYRKDSSGESVQDRGWLDQLSFLPPEGAVLLADKQALCMALDLSTADCAAISTFSQAPDSLSWGVVTNTELDLTPNGDSVLGSPLTGTADESACLTLETNLPAGTVARFNWQLDGASSSVLNLQINGAPVAGNSINGSGVGLAGSWQTGNHTSASALNSLGWCYVRSTAFAGREQGWLDQLSLEPPFIYPQILATTPTQVTDDNSRVWQFQVTIRAQSGAPALPDGLQLEVTPENNISTVTITVENSDNTMINHRILLTLELVANISVVRFGLDPDSLPLAVEPPAMGLTVTIEPTIQTLVIPILAQLTDNPGDDEVIELSDLLLGLRIINRVESTELNTNLEGDNSNFATDMEAFNAVRENPEQKGAVDINSDGTIDALDFRLMVRYRAGLRGSALCDEFCLIKLELLLGQ